MKAFGSFIAVILLFATTSHAGMVDPLNASERAISQNMAKQHNDKQHRTTSKDGIGSVLRKGKMPEYQFLLAERHRTAKNDPNSDRRLADVYWYDYQSDILLTNVIDLSTQLIVSSNKSQGTQLPLTKEELNNAIELLFTDANASGQVAEQYAKVTGSPLSDRTSQLQIRAFVFHAETASGHLQAESTSCGINRCAQLMLYNNDNVAIDIMPVVNLSKQKVTDILASF